VDSLSSVGSLYPVDSLNSVLSLSSLVSAIIVGDNGDFLVLDMLESGISVGFEPLSHETMYLLLCHMRCLFAFALSLSIAI
jgi:hypothetical protein